MKALFYILIVLCLGVISCDRIKSKGKDIAMKTEQKVKNKSKNIANKMFPHFDADKADTEDNKKRYEEYLEVALTPDVSSIFCFGDFLGVDYKVLFSFTCDSTTIQQIIKQKNLELSNEPDDTGLVFPDMFDWWNKEKIKNMKAYNCETEHGIWQYLWYDIENKKAYYEEFSL